MHDQPCAAFSRDKTRAYRKLSVIQRSHGESLNNDTCSFRGGDPPAAEGVGGKSEHTCQETRPPHLKEIPGKTAFNVPSNSNVLGSENLTQYSLWLPRLSQADLYPAASSLLPLNHQVHETRAANPPRISSAECRRANKATAEVRSLTSHGRLQTGSASPVPHLCSFLLPHCPALFSFPLTSCFFFLPPSYSLFFFPSIFYCLLIFFPLLFILHPHSHLFSFQTGNAQI